MKTLDFYPDYDDVLIKPKMSRLNSRKEVDLTLNINDWKPIPIMSANMDTVTDTISAFELLKANWIAVLHKYVSIPDIKDLFDKIDEYNLTSETKIDYRNLFISRGTSDRDKQKLIERLEQEPRISSYCIDVANGHRLEVISYLRDLKSKYPDKILMAGNIVTSEAAILYAKAGVDIIKGGIGPGSGCLTRVQTGVGLPQIGMIFEIKDGIQKEIDHLSLVNNISEDDLDIIKKLSNVKLCVDGGMKTSGDIAKSFVAGGDFVMLGGMLAGHKESPGKEEFIDGKKVKKFSGMAAKESQQEGVPDYGVEEGKTVFIPYRGKIKNTIQNIEGGLRSCATYIDAFNISDFKKTELVRTHVQENKIFS